ncbi:hypothetical protein KZP23_01655 [Echinicola marina]|uniref:hypothetical protein n=1 Tax=Echinicola marina TaxID=2859768 RepID=UPI001CF680D1|nr:hypothetical protein [Echinicola marina]UCS93768.1 hypothetical protein KZP23_01655 [Echinicola marina]
MNELTVDPKFYYNRFFEYHFDNKQGEAKSIALLKDIELVLTALRNQNLEVSVKANEYVKFFVKGKEIVFKDLKEVDSMVSSINHFMNEMVENFQPKPSKSFEDFLNGYSLAIGNKLLEAENVVRKLTFILNSEEMQKRDEALEKKLIEDYDFERFKSELEINEYPSDKLLELDFFESSLKSDEDAKRLIPEIRLDVLNELRKLRVFVEVEIATKERAQEKNFESKLFHNKNLEEEIGKDSILKEKKRKFKNVFVDDGYLLFCELIKNSKIGKSKTDIAFIYRMMKKDGFIVCTQDYFKKEVESEEEFGIADLGQFKTLKNMETDKRSSVYNMVLNQLEFKKH